MSNLTALAADAMKLVVAVAVGGLILVLLLFVFMFTAPQFSGPVLPLGLALICWLATRAVQGKATRVERGAAAGALAIGAGVIWTIGIVAAAIILFGLFAVMFLGMSGGGLDLAVLFVPIGVKAYIVYAGAMLFAGLLFVAARRHWPSRKP